jgi:two-component system chemotaxis sensor kinase CheA
VPSERIEQSNGAMLMRRQDRLMPIVAAAHDVTLKDGDNIVFVIAPDGEPFGLLVDGIVDIFEDRLDVEIVAATPGLIGAAHLNGRVVELLDIGFFIEILRAPRASASDRKRRLLLVDDAAFFRDMLSATLQAAGFDVVKAGSGAQAVASLAHNSAFDAVLLDVDLPDGAGFDLAARLRDAGARAPMIALAPFATREIVRQAESASMAGAVGKFQRNQLLDLLGACLSCEADSFGAAKLFKGAAA